MGYFVKSLILHIFVGVVFYAASYISFKDKSTLTNVSLISASELKQKQAQFKKQEQEIQKQKLIKEQEEKKAEQEKAKKQPQPKPKKETPKEEPKKAKKEEKKPTKQVAKTKEAEKPSKNTKSVEAPKTAVSEDISPLPVAKPISTRASSGEISGSFDFDAMATTPAPQVAKEPKQEEKPIVQEIEQEDTRQAENEEFNNYLDSVAERTDAGASSSASAINKEVGLTEDEYNILVAQIKSCWFFRGNAQTDDASLNVQLRLQMNRDATVKNIRVIGDYNTDTRQILLRHARNALDNPSCIPLKLPLNKYEIWKETTIIFSN